MDNRENYLLLIEILSTNVQTLKNQKLILRNTRPMSPTEANEIEAELVETDRVLGLLKERR